MGRDLLWRPVLRILFCILFLGFLFPSLAFSNEDSQPQDLAHVRPMRSIREDRSAHPQSRGVLPRWYQNGGFHEYPETIFLVPSNMSRALTQQYIEQYSSPSGLAGLQAVMNRGGPYLAFIRRELAEREMPWELLYLPVVESAFVPSALSRSGAMGLWQFMMNSIDPFNIQVTEWVDERRDFWISTQGALAKLQDNYAFFEDWKLALAAYNAGLGALNRMIQESGVRDYWGLADRNQLRAETRHYVPRLLAVTQIMSNPRRYGMEVYWPQDPQWMRLELGRPVDLRILSELAGLNEEILLGANTELRYHVTPPGGGYYLKFPALYEEQIKHTLARTDVEFIRHYVHTIQSGDTLLALARHYGATVDQILGANPGTQERFLRIGSRLLIPALTEAGPPPRAASTGLGTLIFSGEHRVQQGETLWSISRSYGIDPETLAEANGMAVNDILREGRILRTPAR